MKTNTRLILPVASIVCWLLCLSGIPTSRAIDFSRLDTDLRSTITNQAVADELLLQAISRLGKVTEPPEFWTRVANDARYTELHRRRCVFALFRRHGETCTSLRQLADKLAPVNWLRDEHIEDALPVVGWIPVDVTPGDSVFRIRVLGSPARHSPSVYLRIQGKVIRDDFSRLVRRQPGSSAITDGVILEFGFSDDYEKWLRP